jgi:hypothetical protein
MKLQFVALLLMVSCARVNKYAYEELDGCPAPMSEEQHESGVVRCRALCSSYARDFAEFDADCKCRCAPSGGGGYRAKPRLPQPSAEGQTSWNPAQM